MSAYETCKTEVGTFDAEVSAAGLTRPMDGLKFALDHLFEAREYFAGRDRSARGVALELGNQSSTTVASVVQSPQLGTVKAASAALAGIMPAYVSHGQANFTSDDRTMLRAYLAETREGLGDADAESFVQEVIATRHLKQADFVDRAAGALCGAVGAQAFVQEGLSPGLRDAVRVKGDQAAPAVFHVAGLPERGHGQRQRTGSAVQQPALVEHQHPGGHRHGQQQQCHGTAQGVGGGKHLQHVHRRTGWRWAQRRPSTSNMSNRPLDLPPR